MFFGRSLVSCSIFVLLDIMPVISSLFIQVRYGLVARICRSHSQSQFTVQCRQGPGSIPGVGKCSFCLFDELEIHVLFAHCSEREILEMDATLRVGKQHAHALRLNKNPGFSISLPFLFSLYWLFLSHSLTRKSRCLVTLANPVGN
jgi:hypothetical protein